MKLLDFTGKTVLVVGGSSGIGNGIAQAFKGQGADVHVWGTRAEPSDYFVGEGSDLVGLHYSRVDVSKEAEIAAFAPPFKSLDCLVLSQGTVLYKGGEFEMPGFRQVMEVNLMSLMACALKFKAMLEASQGTLLIVSSTAAFHSTFGNPAYNASKTGAFGLTRTLAAAWARTGIRVNGIAPGLVDTKLTKVTRDNPKRFEASLQRIPAGRWGTPEDMGHLALFLASPMSSYIYGQTIAIDGGAIL